MGPNVNRRVPLLNASLALSPHGTGERAREASHEPLVALASRSLRAPARAAPPPAQHANPRTSAQKDEAPEACTWGAPLTDAFHRVCVEGCMAPHSEPLANPFAGLSAGRVRSARTVPKCECLRIQVVERGELGRSLEFALSRDKCGGPSATGATTFGRWRGPGACGPAVPWRRARHPGATARCHARPNVPST